MSQALDAIDNGINQYDTDQPPKYVNNTHLSSRVGRLNPDWTDPDQSPEKENAAFQQAMMLSGSEFMEVFDIQLMPWCHNMLCSFRASESLVRLCVSLADLFLYDNIIHLQCQSVRFHVKSWLPARSIVLECLLSRGKVDPSGEIMILDRFCPVRS
jgi:uncharacterized UPF0160 family protein